MSTNEVRAFNKGSGRLLNQARKATTAASSPPDLQTALTDLGNALVGLRGKIHGYVAGQGNVLIETDEMTEQDGPHFAEPVSPWSTHLDGPESIEQKYPDAQAPDGNPHGDAKVIRRRRATEVERDIRIARKRRMGAFVDPVERERWDQELQRLSSELEAIREAERRERDGYKQF